MRNRYAPQIRPELGIATASHVHVYEGTQDIHMSHQSGLEDRRKGDDTAKSALRSACEVSCHLNSAQCLSAALGVDAR